MRLYVNGVLQMTAASSRSMSDNAGALTLGAFGTALFVGGSLDEVAVYSYALSAQQITDHYTAGKR